ncbi:hypothetical protein NONI108955_18670 [Nocardia ninae]
MAIPAGAADDANDAVEASSSRDRTRNEAGQPSADTLGRTQMIPAVSKLEQTAIMPPLEGLSDNDSPAPRSQAGWTTRVTGLWRRLRP